MICPRYLKFLTYCNELPSKVNLGNVTVSFVSLYKYHTHRLSYVTVHINISNAAQELLIVVARHSRKEQAKQYHQHTPIKR